MCDLLIFGGTTEGRLLAELCVNKGIGCTVSVATDYGASLLPEEAKVLVGRLDCDGMKQLISRQGYRAVIDATHPYASEVTANIRTACADTGASYIRLVRRSAVSSGRTASSMGELIHLIDSTQGTVLSTLGSKSLSDLTKVKGYSERMWLRLLPGEGVKERCRELGYDADKVITEKGPFTVEQNTEHIRLSGASVLVTKESGGAGGYPEKAEAARICGAELITLIRPAEQGYSFEEVREIIEKELEE